MPAILRLLPRALLVFAVLFAGPLLLGHALARLPEALYTLLPIEPFTLTLLLSALLAGVCLTLLAPGRRLATGALVVLGFVGAQAGGFYGSWCSEEETRRVHSELAAMPRYNLALPRADQPPQPPPVLVTHNCLLPEDRLQVAFDMTGDLLGRTLALILGSLLIWRRPRPQTVAG